MSGRLCACTGRRSRPFRDTLIVPVHGTKDITALRVGLRFCRRAPKVVFIHAACGHGIREVGTAFHDGTLGRLRVRYIISTNREKICAPNASAQHGRPVSAGGGGIARLRHVDGIHRRQEHTRVDIAAVACPASA